MGHQHLAQKGGNFLNGGMKKGHEGSFTFSVMAPEQHGTEPLHLLSPPSSISVALLLCLRPHRHHGQLSGL